MVGVGCAEVQRGLPPEADLRLAREIVLNCVRPRQLSEALFSVELDVNPGVLVLEYRLKVRREVVLEAWNNQAIDVLDQLRLRCSLALC